MPTVAASDFKMGFHRFENLLNLQSQLPRRRKDESLNAQHVGI